MVFAPVAVIASSSASSPMPAHITAFAAAAPLAISTMPLGQQLSRWDKAAIITGVEKVCP